MKRTAKAKPLQRKVAVTVNVHSSDSLFFRTYVGSAELGGKKWELSLNVGGNVPIVQLPDGRHITFPWPALVEAANEAGAIDDGRKPKRKGAK